MGKKLFRHSQTVHLFSLDKSNNPLRLVGLRRWIILGAFGVILLGVVLWGLFGSIATVAKGKGVFFNPGRLYVIHSKVDGQVGQILTYPQGEVKEGDLLAVVESLSKEIELKEKQSLLTQFKTVGDASKQWELAKLESEIEGLELYLKNQNIEAPSEGQVIKIHQELGEAVSVGTPLFTMEKPGKMGAIYAFIPVASGGNFIKPEMEARISLGVVEEEKWGVLLGKVSSSNLLSEEMQEDIILIPSKKIDNYLNEVGPVVLVKIELEENAKNDSGLGWTSASGPPFKVPTLSEGEVEIILEKNRPISFVIPHE